ncbi:MAG: MlaD family protein [Magnetospiraceae bacterium]
MSRSAVETVMGGVVLAVTAVFLVVAYDAAQVSTDKGYALNANFFKVGGLSKGADVRIHGIKVGSVISQELDPITFDAKVTMNIDSKVKLPTDTVAVVASDGLLGGKFVSLEPGDEKDRIPPGGLIAETKDFRSLEDLVGEIIFLATGN